MPSSLTTPCPYIIEAIIETEPFGEDDERVTTFAFDPFFDQTYIASPDDTLPSGALLNDPLAEFIGMRAAMDDKLGDGFSLEEWVNTQVAYARGLLRPGTVSRYEDGGFHFLGSSDRDDMRAFILSFAELHYRFAPVYAHFDADSQTPTLSLQPAAWPRDSRLIGVALSEGDWSDSLVQEELDWLTKTLVSFILINDDGSSAESVDGLPLTSLGDQLASQSEIRFLVESALKDDLGRDTITDEDMRAHVYLRDLTGLGLSL